MRLEFFSERSNSDLITSTVGADSVVLAFISLPISETTEILVYFFYSSHVTTHFTSTFTVLNRDQEKEYPGLGHHGFLGKIV